jgi:hypothetical protein
MFAAEQSWQAAQAIDGGITDAAPGIKGFFSALSLAPSLLSIASSLFCGSGRNRRC